MPKTTTKKKERKKNLKDYFETTRKNEQQHKQQTYTKTPKSLTKKERHRIENKQLSKFWERYKKKGTDGLPKNPIDSKFCEDNNMKGTLDDPGNAYARAAKMPGGESAEANFNTLVKTITVQDLEGTYTNPDSESSKDDGNLSSVDHQLL